MVVIIGVTYPMTLVLVFVGLRTQWCDGGKKRAERKRGQNNFSKFHFFSREVERVPRQLPSKFCTRFATRLRYRKWVASAELARSPAFESLTRLLADTTRCERSGTRVSPTHNWREKS